MTTAKVLRSEKERFYGYASATYPVYSMLIIVSRGLNDTVIEISKSGKAMALVHKELLGAESDYLAEQFQESRLALPFGKEVVAKSFVYWLHYHRIHIPDAVCETSLDSLIGLWVIADQCQMKSLANGVVDGVWELYLVSEYAIIEFLYQSTSTPLSAIRRLLVTIMEFGMSTRDIDHLQELLPNDFIIDLCRKKFDMPDEKYSMTMRKDFCKRFYEHDYIEEVDQFGESESKLVTEATFISRLPLLLVRAKAGLLLSVKLNAMMDIETFTTSNEDNQ